MALNLINPGIMTSPAWLMIPGGGFGTARFSSTVAVLERSNGDIILVDAAYSRDEMANPGDHFSFFHRKVLVCSGGGPASTVAQLEAMGKDPARVTHIVATHLHLDHIGGFTDFPNAQVVVNESEYASARSKGMTSGYMHIDALEASGRVQTVKLGGQSKHGFPAHHDLLGDGQVLLLDLKGHSAGSVGVLLHDPIDDRSILMAGDSAYSNREYRLQRCAIMQRALAFSYDWLKSGWARLKDFEANNPDIPVIVSHDASNLELVYAFQPKEDT